jgi:hypothetical protein
MSAHRNHLTLAWTSFMLALAEATGLDRLVAVLATKLEPVKIYDHGAEGTRPGDAWKPQAVRMLGLPLAKIQCDGCMGTDEKLKALGKCVEIHRKPDGGAPEARVIWCAVGESDAGERFSVIVANCTWNAEAGRWEERF